MKHSSLRIMVVVGFFAAVAVGCGSDAPMGDPAATLTSAITFSGGFSGMLQNKPMDLNGTTNMVTLAPTTGMTMISPTANSFMVPVNWSGGAISGVNVGFSTGSGAPPTFYNIPVNMSMQGSMMLNIPAMVNSNICDHLGSIQHMIRCYEQVVLPDGTTVSKAVAQQMILVCPMAPPSNPGGGGGNPGTMNGNTYCTALIACYNSSKGQWRTCADGNQHCWYELGSQRFDCASCGGASFDCMAAAMSLVNACM